MSALVVVVACLVIAGGVLFSCWLLSPAQRLARRRAHVRAEQRWAEARIEALTRQAIYNMRVELRQQLSVPRPGRHGR